MKEIREIKEKAQNFSFQRFAGNVVFLCLILLDWTDINSAVHALFVSAYAQQPMIVVGQLASLIGWSFTTADFSAFAVATAISLTIFIQGKDLILRLVHKERPWFQWGMFVLSAIISLTGNAASFYQDMFGVVAPFIASTWITDLVLGFFISYGLFSVVSSESFALLMAQRKRQEVKVTINKTANEMRTEATKQANGEEQQQTVKKSRKDLTPEERSAIYSRKDRKPKVTALIPVTTVQEVQQ